MNKNQNPMATLNPAEAKELFRILGMIEKETGTWMFQMKDSKISQEIGSFMFVEIDLKKTLLSQKATLSPQSTNGQMEKPLAAKGVDLSFIVDKNRLKHLNALLGSQDIDIWYNVSTQAYMFENKYNRLDIPAIQNSQVFTQSPCTNLKSIGEPITLDTIPIQQITKYVRNYKPRAGHLLIYDSQLEGYQVYGGDPFFFNPNYSKELMKKKVDSKHQISFFLAMMGKNKIDLKLGATDNESGKIYWLISESTISKGITLKLTQQLF